HVPAGAHEDGAAGDVVRDRRRCAVEHDPGHTGDALERELGEVVTVGEPVERRVEVRAGVGDHVDATDLELVARRVPLARRGAGQVIADLRGGKARVGDQPVGDGVTEVDEVAGHGRTV